MHQPILEVIVFWVMGVIGHMGYPGIFFLMTLESALIPIPSEVIMPFSGFLVSQGKFSLLLVVLVGAMGNLFGSLIAYYLGYVGHKALIRKLIVKYGRFILLSEDEFDTSLKLFHKYGQWVAAIARVIPGVRTVISLPAGIVKLPLLKFSLLTFIGSFIWSLLLAVIGVKLGENWEIIRPFFRKFDIIIIIIAVILVSAYIYHKLHTRRVNAKKT